MFVGVIVAVGVTVFVGVIVGVGVCDAPSDGVIDGVGVMVLVGVAVVVGVGVGLGTEYVTSNEQFSFVFNSVTVEVPSGTETRTPKLVVKLT